jgi:hypothetical protein
MKSLDVHHDLIHCRLLALSAFVFFGDAGFGLNPLDQDHRLIGLAGPIFGLSHTSSLNQRQTLPTPHRLTIRQGECNVTNLIYPGVEHLFQPVQPSARAVRPRVQWPLQGADGGWRRERLFAHRLRLYPPQSGAGEITGPGQPADGDLTNETDWAGRQTCHIYDLIGHMTSDIGPDGYPMELHHVDQTPNGGIQPLSRTDHRLGPNYKKNHPPTPQPPATQSTSQPSPQEQTQVQQEPTPQADEE